MPREMKIELLALFLYCCILLRLDKKEGLYTAARVCMWYSHRARDLGNWAWTQAIHAENAARELVTP